MTRFLKLSALTLPPRRDAEPEERPWSAQQRAPEAEEAREPREPGPTRKPASDAEIL